jgi:hypothetical protein
VRAADHEPLARAVAPVEAVLREFAAGDVLELPMTAWRELDLQALPYADASFDAWAPNRLPGGSTSSSNGRRASARRPTGAAGR